MFHTILDRTENEMDNFRHENSPSRIFPTTFSTLRKRNKKIRKKETPFETYSFLIEAFLLHLNEDKDKKGELFYLQRAFDDEILHHGLIIWELSYRWKLEMKARSEIDGAFKSISELSLV